MTLRQSLMKTFYPIIMLKGKIFSSEKNIQQNDKNIAAPVSFYSLHATANDGSSINFESFKGKKVLLVNTASDCGYTGQYSELEELYQQHKNNLIIIGFPANDFKEQEKGNDEDIATFCKINYGVSFLLMKKSVVIKDSLQNEVFAWLSDSTKNGWCNQQPTWNFNKYLVNETGTLTYFFDKDVSPLDKKVLKALQ